MTDIHIGNQMIDVTGAEIVELRVRGDGRVIWVNVDGVCRLRVCQIEQVYVEDEREQESKP